MVCPFDMRGSRSATPGGESTASLGRLSLEYGIFCSLRASKCARRDGPENTHQVGADAIAAAQYPLKAPPVSHYTKISVLEDGGNGLTPTFPCVSSFSKGNKLPACYEYMGIKHQSSLAGNENSKE